MEPAQPAQPDKALRPPPSGGPWIVLILTCLAGLGLALVVYNRVSAPKPERFSGSDFNFNQVDVAAAPQAPAAAPATAADAMPPSRLYQKNGADAGIGALAPGAGSSGSPPAGNPAGSLTQLVRKNESIFERLARAYSKKYPLIRQYGRDWMKYPDLHRYNDQYFQDHDPLKFARNVAGSPSFAALVKQYANRPEMIGFVTDAVKSAPGELFTATQDYLKSDATAVNLLKRFGGALGLPDTLVVGITGGQVDGTKAAADLINNNPQIQNLMKQNNIDPNQQTPATPAPVRSGTRGGG